jgi:hypothetical protein
MTHTTKKVLTVRVEPDDFGVGRYMVTEQVEGFPKTTAFLDDDLVGLQESDAKELAKKVAKETRRANPELKVVLEK